MREILPDLLSLSNAVLGFIAIVLFASGAIEIGARLILLAGVIDGLDGFTARRTGGTDLGKELDSLADAVSFGVAPAFLVYNISKTLGIPAVLSGFFLISALVRLAAYNIESSKKPKEIDLGKTKIIGLPGIIQGSKSNKGFTGVPSTLAGAIIAALYLAGVRTPEILLTISIIFAYLMLAKINYPKLKERDALLGGGLIAIAAILPDILHSIFPIILLIAFTIFLFLSPNFYWEHHKPKNS